MKSIPVWQYPASYERILATEERIRLIAWFKTAHVSFADKRKMQDELSKRGIMVEYDWVGHRGEWFLATEYDAERQDDYICCCD